MSRWVLNWGYSASFGEEADFRTFATKTEALEYAQRYLDMDMGELSTLESTGEYADNVAGKAAVTFYCSLAQEVAA